MNTLTAVTASPVSSGMTSNGAQETPRQQEQGTAEKTASFRPAPERVSITYSARGTAEVSAVASRQNESINREF